MFTKKLKSCFPIFIVVSFFGIGDCLAESLTEEDLPGVWVPSGQMPREEGVRDYELHVSEELNAVYLSHGRAGNDHRVELECVYKESDTQSSIFVYYCYYNDLHLITLSLGGWKRESGQLAYGYEYWLGDPKPGEIHGGLPVSLKKLRQVESVD